MKNLLTTILILFCLTGSAQIIGVNGTNSPETLVPEVRGYITELTVDTFGLVFRDDKYQGALAPQFELDNVIALSQEMKSKGKVLAVCFTVYPRTGMNVNNAMTDLDKLMSGGVLIYSVRIGNEEWAKVAGHDGIFSNYWTKAQLFVTPVKQRGIKRILIPCGRPADLSIWNSAAAVQINSDVIFQPDYHPYWGKNQAPIMAELGETEVLQTGNTANYLSYQDNFYRDLYNQVLSYDLLGEVAAWHNEFIPTKEWHITEFGPPTAVGHISNCLGFDATTDWFFNEVAKYNPRFVCRFNGPSPTGTAIINPKSKKDETTLNAYVKRLAYYTMQNYLNHKGALVSPVIEKEGVFYISCHNLTRETKSFDSYYTLGNGYFVESISYSGITGENYYSGSGAVEWWDKSSPKTYQIAGAKTFDYIPSLSYGYLTVTIKKIPVYGCMSTNAINYNEAATIDDGSCVFYVPGCMAKDALNFNPLANVDDGSCEYQTVCYKKRWLFSSLPCKIDPKCSVNNCK
jgi:hypothetical protein